MKIGTSLALIAVGLILRYAVDFELPGIDVLTLGSILFFVGLLGLAVTVWLEVAPRRARRPRPARPAQPPPDRRPQARRPPFDPLAGAREQPDDRTRVLRDPSDDRTRRL